MIAFLSGISFMYPFVLGALLALPVLWYILRIFPPAARLVTFPPTRFLEGLVADEHTPKSTPWWILLLRLLIAGLVILSLARPVLHQAEQIQAGKSIRLVIDNSWAAAQTWDLQIKAAEEIITQAGRERADIFLMPTVANLGEDKPIHYGALSSEEAKAILRGLAPQPWPFDKDVFVDVLNSSKIGQPVYSFWVSHGLDEGSLSEAIKILQRQGGAQYLTPAPERLPVLLRPNERQASSSSEERNKPSVRLETPVGLRDGIPFAIEAMDQDGDLLDVQSAQSSENDAVQDVMFEIPAQYENTIGQFNISGRRGAGAILLLDDQQSKRNVGIYSPDSSDENAPLISEAYFIKRALEPFARLSLGTIEELLASEVGVIVLPDVASLPVETLGALEEWVKGGGLLLRFAGSNMAHKHKDQFLLPVRIRAGERALSGKLSWAEPQSLDVFDDSSPFYGLSMPNNIMIKQYVLADPAQELEGKVWAKMKDGTPFITADTYDQGMLVFVHTTANTAWSDFPLSGLYVNVLKRVIQMAGQSRTSFGHAYNTLDPILVMDGFGSLSSPSPVVKPIPLSEIEGMSPDSYHPPGIYGKGNIRYAFNLGGAPIPVLRTAASSLPSGVRVNEYDTNYETDLMPYLLYMAIVLFLVDWVVMIFMSRGALFSRGLRFIKPRRKAASYLLLIFLCFIPTATYAQNEEAHIQYASGFYLAYAQSNDETLNALARRGLENLSETLSSRTSVEPAGVAGINPETDDLSFFPLIYWPVSEAMKSLSSKGLQNIQNYLDRGGTILFDTRDQGRGGGIDKNGQSVLLRSITASLNIPPIEIISDDHVLGRSFYLLDDYPGRYSAGKLWVETQSVAGRDNVSSILVGGNDWIGSWADSYGKGPMNRYSASYEAQQQEMALRFGVNLVMYVLTGNYKADQVHIPYILERLGE